MENLFATLPKWTKVRRKVRFSARGTQNRKIIFSQFSLCSLVDSIVEIIRLRVRYTEFHEISSTGSRERAI